MKTFTEAADYVGIAPPHLARIVAQGHIPYDVMGGRLLFDDQVVEALRVRRDADLRELRDQFARQEQVREESLREIMREL